MSGMKLRFAPVALLVLSLALAACSSMPRLESPKVAVDRVRIDRMTGTDAQFTVFVNLANPNDREIAVDAIDADVRIEDIAVGTAHLALPLRLPARGEASAALSAHAEWSAALRAAGEIARRAETRSGAAATVRYAVSGVATLDGGRTIPFSRSGEFAWSRGNAPMK